jgi:hypothetical protein
MVVGNPSSFEVADSDEADMLDTQSDDIPARFKLANRCICHAFHEEGVCRYIASYYIDLLVLDALNKLDDFHQVFVRREQELRAIRNRPCSVMMAPPGLQEFKEMTAKMFEQVIECMEHFHDKEQFMLKAFAVLKQCAAWNCVSRQSILERTLKCMMAGVSSHPRRLGGPFMDLLEELLKGYTSLGMKPDEWVTNAVHQMLDTGLLELVFRQPSATW